MTTYIHWSLRNYDGPNAYIFNINSAKTKVLEEFLNRFRVYNKNTEISDKEITSLLKAFSTNGQIGSSIIEQINNLNFKDGGNKSTGLYTGAGLFDSRLGADGEIEVKIPEQAAKINRTIRENLQSSIDVLGKFSKDIIIVALKEAYTGVPSNISEILKTKKDTYYISGLESEISDVNVKKSVSRLRENINKLDNISKGEKLSSQDEIDSIIKSVQGCFSAIMGVMYEPVATHAINLAKNKFDTEGKKAIDSAFSASGGIVSARQTGQKGKELYGHDAKEDIELTWNQNEISYRFGASIKLAQREKVLSGKGYINNLHSGYNIGRYIADAFSLAGKKSDSSKKHWEAVWGARDIGNASSSYGKALESWRTMVEYGKYSAALRALSGSGAKLDFAALIIVNNKIYSLYDLLKKMTNEFDRYMSINGIKPDFSSLREQVKLSVGNSNLRKRDIVIEDRLAKTIPAIEKVYASEVKINLKLASLFNNV